MRISNWSSDMCYSDLAGDGGRRAETSGRSLADRDGVNASDRASGNPLPGLQLDHAAAVKIDEEIERAPRAVEHVDRTPAADRHAIDLRFHRERGEIADVEPGDRTSTRLNSSH